MAHAIAFQGTTMHHLHTNRRAIRPFAAIAASVITLMFATSPGVLAQSTASSAQPIIASNTSDFTTHTDNGSWVEGENGGTILNDKSAPARVSGLKAFAHNNVVDLTWETASENGNVGFNIERTVVVGSVTLPWEPVAFVPGKFDRSFKSFYVVVDPIGSSNDATVSYRLRQFSMNGSSLVSAPITVRMTNEVSRAMIDRR
jgi:hypothetical protein